MAPIARSPKELGNIIQRARKQRGMSQTQLANLAGLRQEMVSKIERGYEGTGLSFIYTLFAALDLEMVIEERSRSAAPSIEEIF